MLQIIHFGKYRNVELLTVRADGLIESRRLQQKQCEEYFSAVNDSETQQS